MCAKNGKPAGAQKHAAGGRVCVLSNLNLNRVPLAPVQTCSTAAGEEGQSPWFFLEAEGLGGRRDRGGGPGYFQPRLALFFLLVQMGIWGTTLVLVS